MAIQPVWMRCQKCGTVRQRYPQSTRCGARSVASDCLPCGGKLERCDPPNESVIPARAEWLGRITTDGKGDAGECGLRAIQHLLVRE